MSSTASELSRLQRENRRLQAEIDRLTQADSNNRPKKQHKRLWQRVAIILLSAGAVTLLVAGNLLFWAGRTIIDTDRYVDTVAPLIKDPDVQQAASVYLTTRLYQVVDVEAVTQAALPPRADFLAPSLASKLTDYTQQSIHKLLQTQESQDIWVNAHRKAHAAILTAAHNRGSDGVIDINDVYAKLSERLQQSKLSFLANRKLPSKIGSITVIQSDALPIINNISSNIMLYRYLALALFIAMAAGAVWLARNRRGMVIRLGLLCAVLMLATLIAIRIAKAMAIAQVDGAYQAGVASALQIIGASLVAQTAGVMLLSIAVAFVAWISGPSRSATAAKARFEDLFAGRIHDGIFARKENSLTKFVGAYKPAILWTVAGAFLLLLLLTRITAKNLLITAAVLLLVTLVVEIMAAPKSPPSGNP